jgi:O-acetylserine/cysteine efflux transporter
MVAFMTWICVVPPIPLLILSLSFEGTGAATDALAHLTLTGVACILYLAIVATVVGWAIWGFLLGRYSPSVVAPLSLLVPVFGLLSGALVLGEDLTAVDLTAAALILAGLACATARRPASWRALLGVRERAPR